MKYSACLFFVLGCTVISFGQKADTVTHQHLFQNSGITTGVMNPLYVIMLDNDQYAIDPIKLDKIDQKNIESFSVVKGKEATDHYGILGSNGVIKIKLQPDYIKSITADLGEKLSVK